MPPYGGSSTQTLECTVLYPMLDVFSSVLIYALKYLDLSSCIFVSFPYHYKSYTHVHELSCLHDYITLLEYINCTRYRFLSFDGAGNFWQYPGCRSGLPQSTGDADLFHPMWGSWPVAILLHTLLVVLLSPLNYTYTVSLTTTPWKDSHTHSWSWLVAESKKIDNTALWPRATQGSLSLIAHYWNAIIHLPDAWLGWCHAMIHVYPQWQCSTSCTTSYMSYSVGLPVTSYVVWNPYIIDTWYSLRRSVVIVHSWITELGKQIVSNYLKKGSEETSILQETRARVTWAPDNTYYCRCSGHVIQ